MKVNTFHLPFTGRRHLRAQVRALLDERALPGESRLMWQRALVQQGDDLDVEADLFEDGLQVRKMYRLKAPHKGHLNSSGTPAAFVPPESSRSEWHRVLATEVRIPMNAWRPYAVPSSRLSGLGIPGDIGNNGWMSAEFQGMLLLMPSLTFLTAIAIPSASVWQRLQHPLSMDLHCHASTECPGVLSIFRDVPGQHRIRWSACALPALAFWMEGDRLASLHHALKNFGEPGWTLSLPDRPEVNNFCINAYEDGQLMVVQRVRMNHFNRFFPGDWERIQMLNYRGEVQTVLYRGEDRLGYRSRYAVQN